MEPHAREEQIRARAYALWEQQGRPAGREAEHWAEASRQIDEEQEAAKADQGMDSPEGLIEASSLQPDLAEGDRSRIDREPARQHPGAKRTRRGRDDSLGPAA